MSIKNIESSASRSFFDARINDFISDGNSIMRGNLSVLDELDPQGPSITAPRILCTDLDAQNITGNVNDPRVDQLEQDVQNLQEQIDQIEAGNSIEFSLPNLVSYGGTVLNPLTQKYYGVQQLITNNNIQTNANISGSKMADNSISGSKIIDNSISGSKLTDNSISESKIISIPSSKISDLINPNKISPGTNNQVLQTISNIPTWTNFSGIPQASQPSQYLSTDISNNPIWVSLIQQASVSGLTSDLFNLSQNVSSLQSYFLNARLKLANLTKGGDGTVLSQDLSSNEPSFRKIDSNYVSSLNQNKINMNVNDQFTKYATSVSNSNVTTFVNSLSQSTTGLIAPYDNLGGGYEITNADSWTSINCLISSQFSKGQIAQTVNIDVANSTKTLNIGNLTSTFGMYVIGLNFRCQITVTNCFLNSYYEACQFRIAQINVANGTFVFFYNCTFNQAPTFSVGSNSKVFMFNCNFTSKTISTSTIGSNSNVYLANASNLASFTLPTGFILSGINATELDSRVFLGSPGFYSPIGGTKYLYRGTDIDSNTIALSNISTSGATNGQVITFNGTGIVWNTSSSTNLLPLDNTWTGFNQFNNRQFRVYNSPSGGGGNELSFFIDGNSYDNIVLKNTFGDRITFGYDLTNSYLKYTTGNFFDAYSSDLLNFQIGTSRSLSSLKINTPIDLLANIPGAIRIGTGGNRTTNITDAIFIGGATLGGGNGRSRIFIGWSDDVTSSTPKVLGKDIQFGDSSTDAVVFTKNDGVILFQDYRVSTVGAGCAVLNSVTASVYQPSSIDFKTNLRNKSQEYIFGTPIIIKNYYQKITNLPIYTYTYKKPDDTGEPELIQGICFEDLYDTFSHCTTYVPEINKPKPDISYFDGSENNRKKMVRKGALVEYLILALQEQRKFIIEPMQAKINDLESKYLALVSQLKSSQIIPQNF
jgi:hypothetical protein